MINKQKLTYKKPFVESIEFDYTDIIRTSSCNPVYPPGPTPPEDANIFDKLKNLLSI